ncbi:hypothetical protein [Janthinobacterium sp. LB3P112]|uniref:hypothetical protein n=1 Tax=Janthinobacterium sp. LB3P112 TaxID=3424196 RepID=UPI003F21C4E2
MPFPPTLGAAQWQALRQAPGQFRHDEQPKRGCGSSMRSTDQTITTLPSKLLISK